MLKYKLQNILTFNYTPLNVKSTYKIMVNYVHKYNIVKATIYLYFSVIFLCNHTRIFIVELNG